MTQNLKNKLMCSPIGKLLLKTNIQKIRYLTKSKYQLELEYQKEWCKRINQNLPRIKAVWLNHHYLNDILQLLNINDNTQILDVGCGLATVLHFVNGKRIGIDPLANEYKKMYQYPKEIAVQQGYGEYLPYAKEQFAIVFCSNALDHTSDPVKVVEEIWRVLKSRGKAVFAVEVFPKSFRRDPSHPHCFVEGDVLGLLKDKFTVVFKRVSTWNPHSYNSRVQTFSRTDLILVCVRYDDEA